MTVTPPEPQEFLSGETGHVAGIRRAVSRTIGDAVLDIDARLAARSLDRRAKETPRRTVLVLSVYRLNSTLIEPAIRELRNSRHDVRLALGSTAGARPSLETAATHLEGGKFQNLNTLLEAAQPGYDWLLVVDDDVELPARFLDRFVAVAERFDLALAQPAQTLKSHAAWRVTRRKPRSVVRETRFVEIGPVTAFRKDASELLTPFPDLKYGWGLDLHWSALAAERGWHLGIVDSLPVKHERAPVASVYSHEKAIEEAQSFLTGKPFVRAQEAQQTIVTHRTVDG